MLKKLTVCLILGSMALHCAGRLGVLSFIYENWEDLAYSIGLTSERPIAVCSHKHVLDREFTVVTTTNSQEQAPTRLQAQEIQLFFVHTFSSVTAYRNLIEQFNTDCPDFYHYSIDLAVFHPPPVHR